MLVSSYLLYNKKRTFNMIISVVFSVLLLFTVGLIFSSIHTYMIKSVISKNPYHVSFKADNFKKLNFVVKQDYKDGIMYIKYKKISDTYKNTDLICQKIKCKNIKYNDKLLSLYGISKKENIMKSFKIILFLILVILSVGIYILLSNIFRLSMLYLKKQIGILKSVGMTRFLIIKNLLLENTIVLVIGLIIGSILSLWFVQIFLTVLNFLLKDFLSFKFELSIYPWFIITAFVFIVLVFYLSSLKPILKVSNLSIIEVINGKDNFNKKKIPKYIFRLKPLAKITMFNYKRNKKNYKAIKLCVFIGSILYISFSLYLKYGLFLMNDLIKIPNYDFEIISDKSNYKNLDSLGKNYSKYKIYKTCMYDNKIMVTSYPKEGILNGSKLKIKDKTITNKIKKTPFGMDGVGKKILLTNDFSSYCDDYNLLMFINGNSKDILKKLSLLKIKASYVDVSKVYKFTKNLVLAIKISLYSILIFVSLICIFLIYNTLSISIKLRTKELGIFKSVGFTNKNIKKMLLNELLIILFKTFVYVILISFLISYILYQSIIGITDTKLFLPVNELLFCFITVFFILYLSLLFNCFKIKKNSIINMMFTDNI